MLFGLESISDPFYRYQMEKLDIVTLRNKTSINNIEKVAKDLNRDPNLIVNFFKRKLEYNFVYKDSILTTNKKIKYEELEKLLREFIENFIDDKLINENNNDSG